MLFRARAQAALISLAHTTLAAADGGLFALALGDLCPVGDGAGVNTNRVTNGFIGVTLLAHAQGSSAFFALFLGTEFAGIGFHSGGLSYMPYLIALIIVAMWNGSL